MLRTLLSVVGFALLIYLAWLLLLFLQQKTMMFPGAGGGAPDWQRILPPGGERWQLDTSFGQVDAVLLPSGTSPGPALLYFHGNGESVAQNLAAFDEFSRQGLHVLLVEYPGYAGSDGQPGMQTLNEAGEQAYDRLSADPRVDAARISVLGRSLGAAVAAELAVRRPVFSLVLLSPFTSVADMARGFAAPAALLRDPFDNRASLANYRGPLLVIHGRRDRIIPVAHGEKLVAQVPGAQLIDPPCGHNDCPFFAAPLRDAIVEALLNAPGEAGAGSRHD